jgi:hypothetical protein
MTKNEFITKFIEEKKGDLTAAAKAWNASEHKRARGEAGNPRAFLDYLVEAPRTEAEVKEWLESEGSDNMKRQAGHYIAIADAIARVRAEGKKPAKAAA